MFLYCSLNLIFSDKMPFGSVCILWTFSSLYLTLHVYCVLLSAAEQHFVVHWCAHSRKIEFLFQDKLRRPEVDYGPVRNDPRCGLNAASRSVAQRRIVGGSEAGFGSFPWQAYIRIGTIYTQLSVNKLQLHHRPLPQTNEFEYKVICHYLHSNWLYSNLFKAKIVWNVSLVPFLN